MHPWLSRLRHDLVKRAVWPARDLRDASREPAQGDLLQLRRGLFDLRDEDGRGSRATELWERLRAEAPALPPAARDAFGTAVLQAGGAVTGRAEERRGRPAGLDALVPEDKAQHQGRRALEELRRKQGLHILERLRRDYPPLPVVLLTTTEADFEKPQGPLVYFCENEVVDSRTLAAEITRALDLQHASQEGPVFWGRGA